MSESVSSREERILAFWKKNNIFEKSVLNRSGKTLFSFYDGPPFATGLPHYGHFLAGTIKDVVARYKTMQGFYTPRRFGWDCHGVPIEHEVEKQQGLGSSIDIEKLGIDKFNEECRSIVNRYATEWQDQVEKMGRWVDFSKTWKTMDLSFMESVWWVFSQCFAKELIYEGFKVVPFSTKLSTPLSNFEAGQNYKSVNDPSVVIKIKLKDEENTYLLIWTTTPWTLVSNMAVVVGRDIVYSKIKSNLTNEYLIIGSNSINRWIKQEDYEHISSFNGDTLIGLKYEPIFKYFSHLADEGAFSIIHGDFVTEDDGTGLVHAAPGFGEADFYACKENNIPIVCPVDETGALKLDDTELNSLYIKDADKILIQKLKNDGKLFYRGTINHRYPFCWRTDSPLIYKAVNSWFLKVESIKEQLIKNNSQINWFPVHIKDGRFGKWLEGARDWAISRNRFWGTPIPIWKNDKGEIIIISSKAELEELSGQTINDLHRHFIDQIIIVKDGVEYKRIKEVFDCWFDAGSMPYAQNHYPFENKSSSESAFPADFIAEGIDQTRGWFYTLNVLSTILFDKPAFKNAIVNGIILAEDGNKMSKRLQNYPLPVTIINKLGADAVRMYMLNSGAVKADDLKFSEKGVETILRSVILPLNNSISFFQTYANIYNWKFSNDNIALNDLDLWITSKLMCLIELVQSGMDTYNLNSVIKPLVDFIDDLTNWYIRRSRRRFWSDEDSGDRRGAFYTLQLVLDNLSKIAAPFIPFVAEDMFQQISIDKTIESVHICDFPAINQSLINKSLEKKMEIIRTIISIGHSLRKENKLKVRQPLSDAHVIIDNKDVLLSSDDIILISEELNVKNIYVCNEEPDFVQLIIKPNFRSLGKKAGPHMKEMQAIIQNLSDAEKSSLNKGNSVNISIKDTTIEVSYTDVIIERKPVDGHIASNANGCTVVLNCNLNEELVIECFAREIINKVNTMRKEVGLQVTDRMILQIQTSKYISAAIQNYQAHIEREVLANKIIICEELHDGSLWEINGESVSIHIEKASSL